MFLNLMMQKRVCNKLIALVSKSYVLTTFLYFFCDICFIIVSLALSSYAIV